MRRPLIAANWKMNKTIGETESFINEFKKLYQKELNMDTVLCPPFTALAKASELLKGTKIALGAQNINQNESGAFTGEVSPPMLSDLGCRYVIVGHSERRQIYGETNEIVNKKTGAVFKHGMIPIVCVGETLEQRESNKMIDVVQSQMRGGFVGLASTDVQRLIIAYEPIWAIGTGKTASPQQAQEMHLAIRDFLKDQYGSSTSLQTRIIYGGSVKPENMAELMAGEDVDGGLVGGASLKADSFSKIVHYAEGVGSGQN